MSSHDLIIVELAHCPIVLPQPAPALRETTFRKESYTPDEIAIIRRMFLSEDADIPAIAAALERPLHGLRSKICELGLRRSTSKPWTEIDIAYLKSHYGRDPTSTVAAALGRSTSAVYARASIEGLTEGNSPPYSAWEDAQLRAGYAAGTALDQLVVIIGRTYSSLISRADQLGIIHANHPPDWSESECKRLLALAEEGLRYSLIVKRLADEGFPPRMGRAAGQVLRRLGYSRGWGRPWMPEEEDLLRITYRDGLSRTPLRRRLGRSSTSISWKAKELNLSGTHPRPNGWRTAPNWTPEELAYLTANYDKLPGKAIAEHLKRPLRAIYCKAHALDLKSPWIRPFSEEEEAAIHIAHAAGISLTDLALAMKRDVAVVSKHAHRIGLRFESRSAKAPRTRRADREKLSLQDILAHGHTKSLNQSVHP